MNTVWYFVITWLIFCFLSILVLVFLKLYNMYQIKHQKNNQCIRFTASNANQMCQYTQTNGSKVPSCVPSCVPSSEVQQVAPFVPVPCAELELSQPPQEVVLSNRRIQLQNHHSQQSSHDPSKRGNLRNDSSGNPQNPQSASALVSSPSAAPKTIEIHPVNGRYFGYKDNSLHYNYCNGIPFQIPPVSTQKQTESAVSAQLQPYWASADVPTASGHKAFKPSRTVLQSFPSSIYEGSSSPPKVIGPSSSYFRDPLVRNSGIGPITPFESMQIRKSVPVTSETAITSTQRLKSLHYSPNDIANGCYQSRVLPNYGPNTQPQDDSVMECSVCAELIPSRRFDEHWKLRGHPPGISMEKRFIDWYSNYPYWKQNGAVGEEQGFEPIPNPMPNPKPNLAVDSLDVNLHPVLDPDSKKRAEGCLRGMKNCPISVRWCECNDCQRERLKKRMEVLEAQRGCSGQVEKYRDAQGRYVQRPHGEQPMVEQSPQISEARRYLQNNRIDRNMQSIPETNQIDHGEEVNSILNAPELDQVTLTEIENEHDKTMRVLDQMDTVSEEQYIHRSGTHSILSSRSQNQGYSTPNVE